MVNKIIDRYGNIRYYNEHDQLHREDGPAVEYFYGRKNWYINGILHRKDGPAIESSCGIKIYYIMNKKYSFEEWLAIKDFPLLWE